MLIIYIKMKEVVNIGGEIGLKVDKIVFNTDNDLKKPFGYLGESYIDMSIYEETGNVIHICGKNDWAYLLADALQLLLDYALEVFKMVDLSINQYKGTPACIGLGKNEFRAVDIIHRLRGFGEPIKVYKNIPVVELRSTDGIELYGQHDINELPFE